MVQVVHLNSLRVLIWGEGCKTRVCHMHENFVDNSKTNVGV